MAPETPKTVSSRLLTMKFMQRAVASASSPSGSPDNSDPQSSKRRKLQHSPAQSALHAQIDQATIQAALEDQEAKRQAALAQHAAADTHWTLNTTLGQSQEPPRSSEKPLNVVYVGYFDMDSSSEIDEADEPSRGRWSYGMPKKGDKKKNAEKPAKKKDDSDSESASGDDSSDGSDASDLDERSKLSKAPQSRSQSRSRSRMSAESMRAKDFREKRKKKEVRLNQISSISSGGGGGGSNSSSSSFACFNCKQPGHRASNCPKGGFSRPIRR